MSDSTDLSEVDRMVATLEDRLTGGPDSTQGRAAGVDGRVGLVSGTEDSTPLLFSVALEPDAYLQLDDVVVTVRPVPGFGPVMTCGIVTEVRARHEGANFGSDVFLIADGVLPAQVQEIAEITTTRVEPECYVPRGRERSPAGPPAPNAPRRSTSTRWNARSRSASGATASRST